ncbi:hypothetical protein BOO69_14225 [Sulfitobacter alexandrii]|uniref:Glycolipid-binding domain-containing protein n=1 Tax=Sulfitobacter alexandrii TaxID=1917485 RepID=A0A1J0WJD0_9RHOB|nr:putative glycolipid-binding domain-containing protein [Sulfitobacter alexandrii]APE44439.1 hypothetical protein BOO69_14225 [Sulfitobacter alexandrii]
MSTDQTQLPRKVLWRRIDAEGMDACTYALSGDGYRISGTALYLEGDEPAKFEYRVSCNPDWSTRSARVSGWVGGTERDFRLSRNPAGTWSSDCSDVEGASGLLDVDLGFTPATNTNAIRRLGLAVGEEAETTAVWLDTQDWRFKPLRQVYRRLSRTEFAYRSPSHDYAATLVTDDFGIVRHYPQLWTAVSDPDARSC